MNEIKINPIDRFYSEGFKFKQLSPVSQRALEKGGSKSEVYRGLNEVYSTRLIDNGTDKRFFVKFSYNDHDQTVPGPNMEFFGAWFGSQIYGKYLKVGAAKVYLGKYNGNYVSVSENAIPENCFYIPAKDFDKNFSLNDFDDHISPSKFNGRKIHDFLINDFSKVKSFILDESMYSNLVSLYTIDLLLSQTDRHYLNFGFIYDREAKIYNLCKPWDNDCIACNYADRFEHINVLPDVELPVEKIDIWLYSLYRLNDKDKISQVLQIMDAISAHKIHNMNIQGLNVEDRKNFELFRSRLSREKGMNCVKIKKYLIEKYRIQDENALSLPFTSFADMITREASIEIKFKKSLKPFTTNFAPRGTPEQNVKEQGK